MTTPKNAPKEGVAVTPLVPVEPLPDPSGDLRTADEWNSTLSNMVIRTNEKHLFANGWTSPDGTGVLWMHDSIRDTDSAKKPRVSMHLEIAIEIQRRRDIGWKVQP